LKELPRPVLIQSERRKPKGKNIHSRRRRHSPGSSFKSHIKAKTNPKIYPRRIFKDRRDEGGGVILATLPPMPLKSGKAAWQSQKFCDKYYLRLSNSFFVNNWKSK